MTTNRARIALLVILSFLWLAKAATAQENYKVVDLEVEGNRRATKALILGVSSIDRGSTLTAADVNNSIRRLYNLGIFSDVHIDIEPVEGGLKVYFVVNELPKLVGLQFTGNEKIKTKKLREKSSLGVGGYISPYLIAVARENLLKEYANEGYFQAKIEPSLQYSSDSSEAALTFAIEEKSKVKVEKVVITGCDRVQPSSLVGKMRNRKRGFLKSSDFAQEKYDEDLEKVVEEYHKKGFIDAYLISDSIAIDTASNRMTIFLRVYEGPLYYFGNTTFNNNEKLPTTFLEKQLKFKEGHVFNSEKYQESVYELYSAYQEIGHLHPQVIDERTTRSDSIIDISYTMTEGLPSKINMVKIVGNHKTKEKVIRRELSSFPDQVFSRSRLIRSVRDIMALNYFGNVVPTPIDLPNGDVNIELAVEEKQTGQISAGAGYNSTDKVVGTLGMAIPNFRGNGQNVSFNVDFGSTRNSFILSFTEPWLFGRPTLLGLDAYTTNRRWYDDYTEGRQGGSIKLGRRLRWPDNYFRIYGSYRLERNRFFDFDDDYKLSNSYKRTEFYDYLPADGTIDTTVYIARQPYPGSVLKYDEDWLSASRFSLSITRDSRNLPEFATSGSQLSYTFENTGGLLGGFWEYQKHSITAAKFIPLFWKFALAAKVQYRVVTSPAGDERILISDRFTPGGTAYDGVVRGYDDGDLTPDSLITLADTLYYYEGAPGEDPTFVRDTTQSVSSYTTRVRGKYMLVSNIEIQIPISEQQIYGLLFFDAGNSWLNRSDIKPFKGLYKGVGFGFRIVVPGIGTIGFDFAKPLDKYRGELGGWKPHFQIGTTFR